MAIDKEKIMEIYSAISEISDMSADITQTENVEWVFDNYEIDPDELLAGIAKVVEFLDCYKALEEAEDERAEEEWKQKQQQGGGAEV
jgi:hypothetical protein